MDTVGMELGRLLPKMIQTLKKIQEIRQEQDPGPDKALAKLQSDSRKKRNAVKFWIKVPCSWGKKAHKIKKTPTSNSTWKILYQNARRVHISLFISKKKE